MQTISAIFNNQIYPLYIGGGTINLIGSYLLKNYPENNFVIISDKKVYSLYGKSLMNKFHSHQTVRPVVFPQGEKNKNMQTLNQLYVDLHRLGANRKTVIIALGGGVTGDIAGFAAATYMRGIPYIQVPTTLLSMVDSSVGAKTGVDLPEGKNLIGCFYPPLAVFIDPDFLRTLPPREIIAGFAEVLKYGIMMDPSLFRRLKTNEKLFMKLDGGVIEKAIGRCCRLKNRLVKEDPFDRNQRKILNFGHTFGHALETLGHYSVLRHGEAVMIGMRMAVRLSEMSGMIKPADARPISVFLEKYVRIITASPTVKKFIKNLDVECMIHYMQKDKKKEGKPVPLILIRRCGRAENTQSCTVSQIKQAALDVIKLINSGEIH